MVWGFGKNAGDDDDYRPPTERTSLTNYDVERTESTISNLKERINLIIEHVSEVLHSLNTLAFFGGTLMCLTSLPSFILGIIALSFRDAMSSLYILAFGAIICIVEGKDRTSIPAEWQNRVFYYAKIFDFIWGRGALGVFAGVFQITQGRSVNLSSGVYNTGIGILAILISYKTTKKLARVRDAIYSESDMKRKLREFDSDQDSFLDAKDFESLCDSVAVDMNKFELVAAFSTIDIDNNGLLSYEEFYAWWSELGMDHVISERLKV